MTEDQNTETLMAKTPEPEVPPVSPKKRRRWVIPLIWALSILLALCIGGVAGGGIVYGITRVRHTSPLASRVFRFVPRITQRDVPQNEIPRNIVPSLPDDLQSFGALIVDVTANSPAERAGLKEGDVIVALDGQELEQDSDLADLVAGHEPGDTVTLDVWVSGERNQEPSEVTVTLGEHPDRAGSAYLGVTFVPVPGGGSWMERGRPFGGFEWRFQCEGENCPDLKQFFEDDARPRSFRFSLPGNRSS